jgi:hypothetical protein
MLKITVENFDDLTDAEKEERRHDGYRKEYAEYLRITQNKETILLKSDAMEPEDAKFCRDLKWVEIWLKACYEIGKKEAV